MRRALRLVLVLAEQRGPLEMAQEVRQRLAAVERSSRWLDQKHVMPCWVDLDRQRRAIVGSMGIHDPDLAVELLCQFLDLAKSLADRCDCGDDAELPLFHQASADSGPPGVCCPWVQPNLLADHGPFIANHSKRESRTVRLGDGASRRKRPVAALAVTNS